MCLRSAPVFEQPGDPLSSPSAHPSLSILPDRRQTGPEEAGEDKFGLVHLHNTVTTGLL